MLRKASHTLTLAALWMLLSFDHEPLLLALGLASTLLVAALTARMGLSDAEGHPVHLLTGGLRYWPWLLLEIAKSNLAVARSIIDPRLRISPRIVTVPTSQRTDLGRVVYANSITLTPGTVSILVDRDTITVHALTVEGAEGLAAGDMDRRVTRMEAG
ncbi:MAG: Na+/H+ antiporter subunit E [Rhodospirillaceae bacterium]|nr:Na+/H+ antiporter subunit E [Rhodospirillaceae bacterium]